MPLSRKNIIFDVGGVLLEYNPKEYVDRIIQDPQAAQAVYTHLFDGNEWVEMDGGRMTEEEGIAQVISRIPKYAQSVRLAMEQWPLCLSPMKGMLEILRRLKTQNVHLYVLSNTSLRFYEYCQKFDVFRLFDGMVISAKEKLLKPDPAIYRLLLDRYHLNAKDCLFVDDRQANIEGAQKTGMHGHHFKTPHELDSYFKSVGLYG